MLPFFNVLWKQILWNVGIYSYTFDFDTFNKTLSKVSFSDILRNDYWDHFDTFGENFYFDTFKNDTFKNDTFKNDTFESVWVDRIDIL